MKTKVKLIIKLIVISLILGSNVYAANISEITDLTDLTGEEYYYTYAKEMVENGIINGYPDKTFGGNEYITWAEALTMIVRGTGIEITNVEPGKWYESTHQWYIENNLISCLVNMEAIIDRQSIVSILNKIYEVPEYTGDAVFADTDDTVINSFYHAGIINGYSPPTEGNLGIFGPEDSIKRGDFCIIESKILNNFKVKDDILYPDPEIIEGTNFRAVNIPTFGVPENLITIDNYTNAFLWMNQNDKNDQVFVFECSNEEASEFVMELSSRTDKALDNALKSNYYAFSDKCFYTAVTKLETLDEKSTLRVKLRLENMEDSKGYSYAELVEDFESKFKDMVHTMGVTNEMTIKEKALQAYKYIDYILKYDTANMSIYDIENECAICTGYTALYDYMLKRMGIESIPVVGSTPDSDIMSNGTLHVWTGIIDDNGEIHHCDVTWGDPIPDKGNGFSDEAWFWLTYDELISKNPGRIILDM